MPTNHTERIHAFDIEELDRGHITPEAGYPERTVSWFKEKLLPDIIATKERLNLGETILDAGCAYGYFTEVLGDVFGNVVGVDFAPSRIEAANKLHSKSNVKFEVVDLINGKIDGVFDSAISCAVFQHIDPEIDRKKAFQTVFDALKSNGYLVLYDELLGPTGNEYNWDGFYRPLSLQWIDENLNDLCFTEKVEPIVLSLNGEQEYRFELRKK